MKPKHIFFLGLFILVTVKAIISPTQVEQHVGSIPIPSSAATEHSSPSQENWFSQVENDLKEQEYAIHWQADQQAYSSPNRENNLRFTFHNHGFSLKPRIDSVENWNLDYEVEGVFRNQTKVVALADPDSTEVRDNQMVQHFDQGLHIEYSNEPTGMRQNFRLDSKPAGIGRLGVRLHTKGNLFPIQKETEGLLLVAQDSTGHHQPRVWYRDLQVFDATGAHIPATMKVSAAPELENGQWLATIDLEVDDSRATYPILIDPISTTAAASVESNQANSQMGYAVSSAGDVNGDGYSDVLVSAFLYDNGQTDEGAVFIYHGAATGISTSPALVLESNQAGAQMGNAVSTAGNVNGDAYADIIIGASQYTNGEPNEGAVYVHHGSATGIMATPALVIESNQAGAKLGWSVACAGDVNDDGYSDVVFGAYQYANGQPNEGVAWVHHGSATGLGSTYATLLEANQTNADMGFSVASAGDVNGDGFSDVVVGARAYDNGQSDEGAAFIYHGGASGISNTAITTIESNQANAFLGYSVASAGDVNGDGYSDVITGIYLYDNGQNDEGGAFICHGGPAGVNATAATVLESNQVDAYLGYAVASAGDVNGDGYGDVVVGARRYDNGQVDEGAAFVYQGSATGIPTIHTSMVESDQAGAELGYAVASAGDVNGDGYSDLVIGAPYYDNGQTDEGAAFIYHGKPMGMVPTASLIIEGNTASLLLGSYIASAGDVNGDGYSDMVVGVASYDNGQTDEGAAFIYMGSPTGLGNTPAVILESNQGSANMGRSVACAGDVNGDGYSDIIVGLPKYDNGQTDEGMAWIYHGSPTGIATTPSAMLEPDFPNSQMASGLGAGGDINGDGYSDVVVGALNFKNTMHVNEGGIFVYHGSPTGISTTPVLVITRNFQNAHFGNATAFAGDVNGDGFGDMIIGCVDFNAGNMTQGAAIVYYGAATGLDSTASDTLRRHQSNARMGESVAGAGDVNGDGYSDVIVGATYFNNGQTDEGAAFIYLGSATGIDTIPATLIESNQANAHLGVSVASAGDLNGDGYSDVVAGTSDYENGQTNEGAFSVHYGSPTGVSTVPSLFVEANLTNTFLGRSVASGGDVNGDGYSDLIVGANVYSNGQNNEGAIFVYHGNGGPSGLSTSLRQYQSGTFTEIRPGGQTTAIGQVRFSMKGKSFIGRQKGKMVYEYKSNGQPFSAAGGRITNSVAASGLSTSYATLSGNGTLLTEDLTGVGPALEYKWRSRVSYNPATAITGQVYGPWYYHKSRTPETAMLGFKPSGSCGNDATAPIALCQAVTVTLDTLGNATIPPTSIDNGSTDNCSISALQLSQAAFTCTDLGTNAITLTVTDGSGNTGTCTTNIMVMASPLTASIQTDTNSCGYPVSCAGGNDGTAYATASSGCGGYTYLWSNGATSSSATGLGAGLASVTITDIAGTTTVQSIFLAAPPTLQASGQPLSTCFGDATGSINLTVSGGNDCQAYTYQWSNGAATEDIASLAAGNYSVTVTDAGGCTAIQSITVGTFPALNPTITQTGNTLTAAQTWTTYQWLLNGTPIPGANTNAYIANQSGTYTLSVTDPNGCTEISNAITITIVGISPGWDDTQFTTYPNPNNGSFHLSIHLPNTQNVNLTLYNALGQVVNQRKLDDAYRTTIHYQNLNLPPGVYQLQISSDQFKITKKVVVTND